MSDHKPPTPRESARRRARHFALLYIATLDARPALRRPITDLARTYVLGGLTERESLGTLDALADALDDLMGRMMTPGPDAGTT